MARILVTALPFAGHVGPLSAVAAELVRRGHQVVAYSGAKYRDRFVDAGTEWLPWNRAQDFDDADPAATFPQLGDGKGIRGTMANGEHILFGTSPGQAGDILAEARREPFDLIVTDQLAFGSALAGEALGTPWASVAVTPLTMASRHLPPPGTPFRPATGPLGRARDAVLRGVAQAAYKRLANPKLARIRAEVGLGPTTVGGINSLFYSPHLVLAQGVPGLEYPRADLPTQVHFVGRLAPVPGPDKARQPPSWWPELAEARAAGRPVVHVTQGTLDLDLADLVKPAISGLAGREPLMVCTTGRPPSALGQLPDNVRAAAFLPHDLLLPLVDAMVTNGGWGGVLAAVQAGVPLVVAGGSLDKPEVARRVAWSGVGIDLRTGRPGPAKLRRAVAQVLDRPELRRRARELATGLIAAGGTRAAGDRIEDLLAGSRS
jgi:UDP:flavonoid glycosyltransferase YjiC (YdhE family)